MNMSFDLSQIIGILGIAVFLLPTLYLMGYARYEKQHKGWAANAREGFKAERDIIRAQHMDELVRERTVIRELEIGLLQAGEAIEKEVQNHAVTERNRVKSDGYRQAIVQMMLDRNLWSFAKHYDVPATMLQLLLEDAAKHAVDPAVSQKAKNLHTRGVRKGAKMGREQMRKLMQKSIDNQVLTIEATTKALHSAIRSGEIHRDAVCVTLEDKVALPGVRKALCHAISEEIVRLRRVDALKG